MSGFFVLLTDRFSRLMLFEGRCGSCVLVNDDAAQGRRPLQHFELSFLENFLNIFFSDKVKSQRLF
jgi:hypothetical protein